MEGRAFRFRQRKVEEQGSHNGNAAVQQIRAMPFNGHAQQGISLDHNEHKHMRRTCSNSAHNSTDLLRVQFSDHDPRHDQVAQGAGHREEEEAGDWNPRVHWLDFRLSRIPK